MSDELRKELREVQAEQADYARVESDFEELAQFSRQGSWWNRFCLWCAKQMRDEGEDCARVRREIEKELRGR